MRSIERELRLAAEDLLEPFADRVSWRWDQKEKHPYILLEAQGCPTGKVYYPATPSDFRVKDNFLSELRHRLLQMGVLTELDFAKPARGSKSTMALKLQEALAAKRAKEARPAPPREEPQEPVETRQEPEAAQEPEVERSPPEPAPAPVNGIARPVSMNGDGHVIDGLAYIITGALEHLLLKYVVEQDHKIAALEKQIQELEDAVTRPTEERA